MYLSFPAQPSSVAPVLSAMRSQMNLLRCPPDLIADLTAEAERTLTREAENPSSAPGNYTLTIQGQSADATVQLNGQPLAPACAASAYGANSI